MARSKQPQGNCLFCGYVTTKGAMSRHLAKCPVRQERIAESLQSKRKPETLHYLRAQDAVNKDFWLDLEVTGSAKLEAIDVYLRAIWLECCGHMSEFSFGGWGETKIGKQRKVDTTFEEGVEITHIYDFGTSSETTIKEIGQREGVPLTVKPVTLMARNQMPETVCIQCDKQATHLCMECVIEDDVWGTLCDEHAATHPHDDYGKPSLLYNSPRMGMCGYEGPAEPPY